jgi:DNA-directed RNA polymerase subunit RPC12/RpoP
MTWVGWQCVRCGTTFTGNPRTCPGCGHTVYAPINADSPAGAALVPFCATCSTPLPDDVVLNNCPACGSSFNTTAPPSPPLVERARAQVPALTVADIVANMAAINDAIEASRRSYREALSAMGAHGAPAVAVVAFAIEWRVRQAPSARSVVLAAVDDTARLMQPSIRDLAELVVDALVETGHIER